MSAAGANVAGADPGNAQAPGSRGPWLGLSVVAGLVGIVYGSLVHGGFTYEEAAVAVALGSMTLVIYFLPSIVAVRTKNPRQDWVLMVNLFA